MPRYLAIADSQFGATTVTLESQENVWDQAVTLAIEHGVDGVLHAGDLFEHAIVEGQVLAAFRRPLARLRAAGIPMLLIRGNHDGAVRPVDALDVFHEYDMLTVSQRPELVDFAEAAVVTLPWVSPKHLVASSNGASRENVYEYAADLLVGIASDLHAKARETRPGKPAILLLHWSVSGASLPTGLPVDQLREVVLPWPDLDELGFDAVVAGHIHKAQRLDDPKVGDTTTGFYAGSPQPLNHGEPGEHGVWVLDIPRLDVALEFLPMESPQFVTLDLDVSEDALMNPELPAIREGDIVRVRYQATREQDAKIDKTAITRDLKAAGARSVDFRPTIIREARSRAEHLNETLSELDALAAYCDAQGIEAGMRERMLARTGEWL